MKPLKVSAIDSQGIVHIFDNPISLNVESDPFLCGVNYGRREAAKEILELIDEFRFELPDFIITSIKEKFEVNK